MTDRYSDMPRRIGALAVLALLCAPAAAVAQKPPDLTPRSKAEREYAACMALARIDPKAAHESALAWRARKGGEPAAHCIAVALLGLGEYGQAAEMMEDLARHATADRAGLRADMWGQAGNAWLIAGKTRKAARAFDRALALKPDDPGRLIDRSIARTSEGEDWTALDDLNRALELDPDREDALRFRAAAWRRVGAPELARQDIDRALALRPANPDALLERGLIKKAQKDMAGARADWQKVLDIAVEGPLRQAARRYLEALDVRANVKAK